MRHLSARGVGWLGLLLAGCGEYGLADETHAVEPVATLEGEVRAGIGQGKAPTEMTLAWAPDLATVQRLSAGLVEPTRPCGAEREALLQTLAFQAHYPSYFVLPVSTPPMPAAQLSLAPAGGRGRLAFGWVLFFQDDNGNGVLDQGLRPERVVASSLDSGMAVLFLDGELAAGSLGAWTRGPGEVPRGFSLLGVRRPADAPPALTVLPASTPLFLEASRRLCP